MKDDKRHSRTFMHSKGTILTPHDMAKTMENYNGIANDRFDLLNFSHNRLDYLFDDSRKYY